MRALSTILVLAFTITWLFFEHRGLLGALDLMIAQATKQKMLVTYFCAFG